MASFSERFAPTFVNELAARGIDAIATESLEGALTTAITTAVAAFPEIELARDRFLAFLAERVAKEPRGADVVRAVANARAADLYLACACAFGDAKAITALERRYADVLAAAVPRRADRARLVDETKQILFERLFVPKDGAAPKISEYGGRGDLAGFLRVAAARVTLNLLRSEKRRANVAEASAGDVDVPLDDPELARIESIHRDDFRGALRDAAKDLATRERNLLRQHHIDGLTMDQLASLYGLHRVTVIRAIQAAREKLAEGTRRRLRERLRINQAELESLMRVIGSKLDWSIQRYLREDDDVATGSR